MGYYNNLDWVDAPGYEVPFGEAPPVISFNMVTPDYFRTMHIPLLEGRVFTRADLEDAPWVAVVNESIGAQVLARPKCYGP